MIDDGESQAAKAVVVRLSEFLRRMLDTIDTPEITVAEEINFLRSYLDIEHARFGTRMRATINATPSAMPALIPTLMLQPLVENAIKHGILSRELGGSIDISISTNEESLTVTVANSGQPSGNSRPIGTGTGLKNTASRLDELYGRRASVEFRQDTDGRNHDAGDSVATAWRPSHRRSMRAARMIRALIVDDEDHGRRGVANRLSRFPDFEIVGICETERRQ